MGLRLTVIADDITGAAEIAGIAHCQGQRVQLVCSCPVDCGIASVNGTTVIATDTRSMSESEAIIETHRITSHLSPLTPHLFKKTDSTLRGHVVAELSALMEDTGFQRAVYLPANPSKGRTIKNGVYYIKEVRGEKQEVRDVPISETAFSYDPEFPAKTSFLRERFPNAESKDIIMPDAENEEDIRRVIAKYNDGKTIFAGAADLFSALLSPQVNPQISNLKPQTSNLKPQISNLKPQTSNLSPLTSKDTLILCGSTQSKPLDLSIPVAPMPREVYDGNNDISLWDTSAYEESYSLILTMPYTHRTGKEAAVHLRTVMAQKTMELIAQHRPDHLIIEGGATAWATLKTLGWTQFDIVGQIAPGVVQMCADNGTLVTLKPGSYPWGNLFSEI